MKNPLLYRSAWPESSREASERFLMETLGRTQSERRRAIALRDELSVRDARWSEAVAVGNLNFVEKMKSEKRGGAS